MGGPACGPIPSHPAGPGAGVTSPLDGIGTKEGSRIEELRHGPKEGRGKEEPWTLGETGRGMRAGGNRMGQNRVGAHSPSDP